MRSLIRNVSHSSRWAPRSTVNFAMNPASPPSATGGTISSDGCLVAMLTFKKLQVPSSNIQRSSKSQTSKKNGASCLGAWCLELSDHVGDEIAAVEGREVLELLPCTDEPRRDAQLILDRDDDAAFAAAVQFRHDQSGQADGLMKFASLRKGVAPRRGIDDEQRFIRRFLVLLRQAAFHLRQFGHQITFGVEPAGGVAKQELDVFAIRRFVSFVTKRGWIRVVLAANHL